MSDGPVRPLAVRPGRGHAQQAVLPPEGAGVRLQAGAKAAGQVQEAACEEVYTDPITYGLLVHLTPVPKLSDHPSPTPKEKRKKKAAFELEKDALQRKSPLCIFFLGIAPPQPQFQHSCVCEQFI